MMDHELLKDHERRITDMETLMQGKISDGIQGGSVIHVMARVVETLYGPRENPGGLVKDVADNKRFMAMMMGGFTVLNILVVFAPTILKAIMSHK